MATPKAASIDEYISGFAEATQKALQELRTTIRKAAPDAEETISYAIPCFKLNGKPLIYFAGYKNHIGLYPVPTANEAFEKDFAAYKTSGKGTLQLPLQQPMPLHLVEKIATFRANELLAKKVKKKSTFS